MSILNKTGAELEELLAECCNSPPHDIHHEVAKKLFNTDNPTVEQRAVAKRRNYLHIYGGNHDDYC